jgi:hypothetical protein
MERTRFRIYPRHNCRVPHTPDFLFSFVGSLNFMRLSLERRTRGPFESCVQEIRGISFVFREMWDTAGLALKPLAGPTTPHGFI